VYGAFITHPRENTLEYDRDVVVVLSDWSNEDAKSILKNLRKDGDYYLYNAWAAWTTPTWITTPS